MLFESNAIQIGLVIVLYRFATAVVQSFHNCIYSSFHAKTTLIFHVATAEVQ